MLLGVADLVIDYSGTPHDNVVIESAVMHADLFSIAVQVVEFVNINAVARVGDYFEKPRTLTIIFAILFPTKDQVANFLDVLL